MEKGMKAQLKVGSGDGDLPSIPGITANAVPDDYKASLAELAVVAEKEAKILAEMPTTPAQDNTSKPTSAQPQNDTFISGLTVIGLAIGLLLAPFLAKKFKGMSVPEIITYIFEQIRCLVDLLANLITNLTKLITSNKNKTLPGN